VLFYGDSIITPAISVLSAVEGLQIIAPSLADYVLPITITVLGGTFSFCKQKAPVKWASYFRRSCVSGFVYLPF